MLNRRFLRFTASDWAHFTVLSSTPKSLRNQADPVQKPLDFVFGGPLGLPRTKAPIKTKKIKYVVEEQGFCFSSYPSSLNQCISMPKVKVNTKN